MTRFFWVRHGPTNARAMFGWTDLPADLADAERIARLSRHLPSDAPVVSSDLARAVQTADAIAGARPRLPHDPALREMHFGAWEMLSYPKAEARDPMRIWAFWDQPGDASSPGGESWNDIRARVDSAIDRLAASHEGGDLIIVSHLGAILTQVQRALGVTAREAFARRIGHLSVTEIRFDGNWTAARINHDP